MDWLKNLLLDRLPGLDSIVGYIREALTRFTAMQPEWKNTQLIRRILKVKPDIFLHISGQPFKFHRSGTAENSHALYRFFERPLHSMLFNGIT